MRSPQPVLAVLMLLAVASQNVSATQQNLDEIRQLAEQFALQRASADHGGHVKAVAARMDRRLRLTPCDRPLEAFPAPGNRSVGNISVGVRCDSSTPWSLYVSVTVQVLRQVVIATTTISHHSSIPRLSLRTVERDITRLQRGYFSDPDQLLDKQLRHTITEGSVISPDMISNPRWVRRGQRVNILGGSKQVRVSTVGVAMGDGRKGQRVRVRNLGSGRIIEGEVVAKNTIQVP